ncbi:abortive infection family protein [Marilutibacter maris]|uniref:abortive infection family protein n=1 Tax=Marilutibacter maris TaxID=1605891 RepID=UPI001B863CC0|nr:abortive infection family protein [Lysobacter maris]
MLVLTAELASERETHATLDSLFTYADAPGDPPEGSKHAKALAWLRRANKESPDPLRVLGRVIEGYMDEVLDPNNRWDKERIEKRLKICSALASAELQYVAGGKITGAMGTPTRTLSEFIRERDLESIEQEFQRAVQNATASPRDAVSAASNILESVCKVIIADENLPAPAKQDLQSVWNVVRKHLGMDPSRVEDKDLQQILTGLLSVVHGIGSLRTHASSAHGAGRTHYKLEPRHARLAIHSAHTLCLFVLESWRRRGDG